VRAVTFDFYDTLVYHRAGIGRGRRYQEYLAACELRSDPWEHRVLYDVFEYYGAYYDPTLHDQAKLAFWTEFTRRLFERTNVRSSGAVDPTEHASAVREIMGPACLALFDETLQVLRELRERGHRLGVISDWQKGLAQFCEELGIARYLEVVVASADVGHEKPDPRLFEAAREQMNVPAEQILHVGDRLEDVEGARAAGFSAVLLVRGEESVAVEAPVVGNLRELLSIA
jgi:HAD superfamily hydrolase (TIGR01549 family)